MREIFSALGQPSGKYSATTNGPFSSEKAVFALSFAL